MHLQHNWALHAYKNRIDRGRWDVQPLSDVLHTLIWGQSLSYKAFIEVSEWLISPISGRLFGLRWWTESSTHKTASQVSVVTIIQDTNRQLWQIWSFAKKMVSLELARSYVGGSVKNFCFSGNDTPLPPRPELENQALGALAFFSSSFLLNFYLVC